MGLSVAPHGSCGMGDGHSLHSLCLAMHLQPPEPRQEQIMETGNSEQDTASLRRPHCSLSFLHETLLCSVYLRSPLKNPITLSFPHPGTLPTVPLELQPWRFLHQPLPSPGSPHSLRTQITHNTRPGPLGFLTTHHSRKERRCVQSCVSLA